MRRRRAGVAFVILGVGLMALGLASSRIFIGVGATFVMLGILFFVTTHRSR